jgi:hypothetical protein
LSDLVPKYLSDTNCLICPVCARTGEKPDNMRIHDPKLVSSYSYQFNAHSNVWTDYYGVALPGDTMKTWKERQLLRYGPVVPVVRCGWHAQSLSVTFAGERRVESEQAWGEQAWEKEAEQALILKQGAATNAVPTTR